MQIVFFYTLILKRHKLLYKGFIDPNTKELIGGIQLDKMHGGNMYTGKYSGFSELDDGLLSLLATFIGTKFSQLKETFASKAKDIKLVETLTAINTLFESRTYMFLLMNIRELLPPLIGYEHIGVYLHDPNSIFWFVIL